MTTAEKYVAAAYLVVFVVVLAHVLIMATKLARLDRELAKIEERARTHPETIRQSQDCDSRPQTSRAVAAPIAEPARSGGGKDVALRADRSE